MALPDKPLSRKEEYLAVIAGQAGVQKPDRPLSRTEEYLDYIAENGGGGGGGASGFEALELVVNLDDGTISTVKTAREVINLYVSGKCFSSTIALNPDPDNLTCLQLHYGTLIYLSAEEGYLLSAFTQSPESIVKMDFSAADLDSVFTASIPN